MRYDVIVVGAGPAGSTAARECAERGMSVALLERAEFPRDKPCGGGVTARAAELLPFSLDDVVERVAYGMSITVRGRHPLRCYASEPLAYLTQRRRLDAYLAERAVAAGAQLRERMEVRAVERSGSMITVRAGAEAVEGNAMVVADGVNGRTGRLAGCTPQRRLTVALEGNLTPDVMPPEWTDVLGIDAGDPRGGYGWIFPKGDHLNFGVATLPADASSLRSKLAQLVRSYGFPPEALWGTRGYHLPARYPDSPLADGNVVLVGDAAGLVDPFSLEGIHAALWSGRAAAHHLARARDHAEGDLSAYAHEVETVLQPDLDAARQIYDLSWLVGWRSWLLAARFVPGAPDLLWRLIAGRQTYGGVKRKLGPFAAGLNLASDAVRLVPALRRRAYAGDAPPPARPTVAPFLPYRGTKGVRHGRIHRTPE